LIPPPEDPQHIPAILEICQSRRIDAVLPVQHDETIQVSKHRAMFEEAGIGVPVPPYSLVELAMDKYRTTMLAQEHGIPTPATYELGEIGIGGVGERLGYPALVKLKSSTGQKGQRTVRNVDELESHVAAILEEFDEDEIIIQELIPGAVHDTMYTVGLLYNHNHELRACVPLKKIRSRPYTGGTAICTVAQNRPVIGDAAIRLMDAIGHWVGIADIEMKVDPRDGLPKFIELNPRPWGSIYGAYAAGVDFPMLWLSVGLTQDFAPVEGFREGVYGSFMVRDLLLLTDLLERLPGTSRKEVWQVLKTYGHPYLRRNPGRDVHKTSDFVLGDLLPFRKNLSRVKHNLWPWR
jgi:predicted ATP-grasp superfamily ATP-dependent carboligase